MRISEVDQYLKSLDHTVLVQELERLKQDHRAGVQKLITKYQNQLSKDQEQIKQWNLRCIFDQNFHTNIQTLVGVDEVGRGPLAGPVVAAAVILPYDTSLVGLRDSKKLTASKRQELFVQIKETALGIGIGIVDAQRIDQINILQATFEAMKIALMNLSYPYDIVLVDGNQIIPNLEVAQHAIIKGDDQSASIAAASIVAKVTRDNMMDQHAQQYTDYDWINNKGYGSAKHYEGIRKFGITPLHRRSFLKKEGIF